MTMRERMLAVVRGKPHDRVPFCQYSGLSGPDEEIWAELGRDNMGIMGWCSLHRLVHSRCSIETEWTQQDGRIVRRTVIKTPEGTLYQNRVRAAVAYATRKHFVQTPQDYRILLCYLRDLRVEAAPEEWLEIYKRYGDDGLPHTTIPQTPYQQLWIEWVSLERLSIDMHDEVPILDEVFAELFRVQQLVFEVVCELAGELPIPYIIFPDNITAPAIGRARFERFCVSSYKELARMLTAAGHDIPIGVHMDGDLRALKDEIADAPIRLIDSFTPWPDSNVTVAEALSWWPDVTLLLNFPSSVHLAEPERIYQAATHILRQAEGSGRLQIQISEDPPPGAWKKSFPPIMRAIREFGPVP